MFVSRKKGQSTLEYVILIGVAIAALIAMNVYLKRGIQGRMRESADQVGEQFEVGQTTSAYQIKSHVNQLETISTGGVSKITMNQGDSTTNKTQINAEVVAAW